MYAVLSDLMRTRLIRGGRRVKVDTRTDTESSFISGYLTEGTREDDLRKPNRRKIVTLRDFVFPPTLSVSSLTLTLPE